MKHLLLHSSVAEISLNCSYSCQYLRPLSSPADMTQRYRQVLELFCFVFLSLKIYELPYVQILQHSQKLRKQPLRKFSFTALALVLVDQHSCAVQFNFHYKKQGNLIMKLWSDVASFWCQFKFHMIWGFAFKMLIKICFKVLRKHQ